MSDDERTRFSFKFRVDGYEVSIGEGWKGGSEREGVNRTLRLYGRAIDPNYTSFVHNEELRHPYTQLVFDAVPDAVEVGGRVMMDWYIHTAQISDEGFDRLVTELKEAPEDAEITVSLAGDKTKLSYEVEEDKKDWEVKVDAWSIEVEKRSAPTPPEEGDNYAIPKQRIQHPEQVPVDPMVASVARIESLAEMAGKLMLFGFIAVVVAVLAT